jgi:hypothetical protein
MEGTRTCRETARKILRVKAGKRAAKFEYKIKGWEDCRMLTECRRKKNGEEGKREILSEKRICQ